VVWLKGHAGLNQQRVQIYFWHQMSMSLISCDLNKNIAWISLFFLFSFFFFFFLVFRDRVSLCSPGCPGTYFVDQAGLELRNPPASASWVLGLKACATMPGWISLLRPVYERKRTLQYGAGGKLGHVGSYEERGVPVETVGAAFRALPFHLLFKTSSWPLPTLPRQPEPQGTPVTLQALSHCCQSNE
jgi:hypothetical protein